jgi:hypothetical protein
MLCSDMRSSCSSAHVAMCCISGMVWCLHSHGLAWADGGDVLLPQAAKLNAAAGGEAAAGASQAASSAAGAEPAEAAAGAEARQAAGPPSTSEGTTSSTAGRPQHRWAQRLLHLPLLMSCIECMSQMSPPTCPDSMSALAAGPVHLKRCSIIMLRAGRLSYTVHSTPSPAHCPTTQHSMCHTS